MRSEARRPADASAAFGLAVVQGPLLLWASGGGAPAPNVIALTVGLAVTAAAAAAQFRRHGARWSHMVLFMLLVGNLGMVAGAWLDFGPSPLLGLTHWCHMHPGLAPAAVAAKLAGAPWSYGLMLLGCNLGMLLSEWLLEQAPHGRRGRPRPHPHRDRLRCYLGCNLGMLAGMLLAEGLMPGGHHHHDVAAGAALGMAGIMAAGMTAGMLLGLRLAYGRLRSA